MLFGSLIAVALFINVSAGRAQQGQLSDGRQAHQPSTATGSALIGIGLAVILFLAINLLAGALLDLDRGSI